MSDEESEIVETAPAIAPGLALALAEEEDAPVRRRRGGVVVAISNPSLLLFINKNV